jgi:hypothetical protein
VTGADTGAAGTAHFEPGGVIFWTSPYASPLRQPLPVQTGQQGGLFCLEDLEAETAFVSICQNFGLSSGSANGPSSRLCSLHSLLPRPAPALQQQDSSTSKPPSIGQLRAVDHPHALTVKRVALCASISSGASQVHGQCSPAWSRLGLHSVDLGMGKAHRAFARNIGIPDCRRRGGRLAHCQVALLRSQHQKRRQQNQRRDDAENNHRDLIDVYLHSLALLWRL